MSGTFFEAAPLADKVALVTGAGSGLGRGISIGLARAGARVALADIDLAAARETAVLIARQAHAKALPVAADIADEKSVARAFRAALRWAGRLDILVNAAGIAPAHPLTDLPLALWKKTLDVNLTGYFLAAREAARIFIRQGTGGNIINLSSKSGLEASVNNTAYNATKAGEIHLARGWALELGKFGIRVNAVAPGNVFKGSKIWNPQYIRQCARKRGIRPEDVIPYYVDLTALKKEIEPEDVANAVIFLCSEAARRITGQTLVCDSGQVLVR
ncbi:MAG: SDR family oxidoreductase [Planctomycetota bacterium]